MGGGFPIPSDKTILRIIAGGVTLTRLFLLDWSDYPIHLGGIEAQYVQAARQHDHSLFYWPLRVLPVEAAFLLLGDSLWVARIPTTLLLYPSILLAYKIGRQRYGATGGVAAMAAFALNPLLFTFYGRVMPDAYLVLGLLLAFRRTGHPAWRVAGVFLAVLAKPLGLVALPLALLGNPRWRETLGVIMAGLAFLIILLPGEALHAIEYAWTRYQGHTPFGSALTILPLVAVGSAPLAWWGLRPSRDTPHVIGVLFVLYAFMDAYPWHAYYALPGMAFLAIAAGKWLPKLSPRVIAGLLVLSAMSTVFVMHATGDLGDERARILEDVDPGTRVFVPDALWFMKEYAPPGTIFTGTPEDSLVVSLVRVPGCTEEASRWYGGEGLFLLDCRPLLEHPFPV